MKKILSYILISVIVAVNLFAPISVGFSKNNSAKVTANVAEAAGDNILLHIDGVSNNSSIKIRLDVSTKADKSQIDEKNSYVDVYLYSANGTLKNTKRVIFSNMKDGGSRTGYQRYENSIEFTGLAPKTAFTVRATAVEVNKDKTTTSYTLPNPLPVPTKGEEQTDFVYAGFQSNNSTNSYLPVCQTGKFSWSISGCAAQFLYYAVFTPASALFALGGMLFDSTFHYSVQSSAYTSPFVVQGWKIIRDIANMFFIFILLYIAFGTILSLNGFKTKEMIVNVIIIGLLINFSLFAARIVIDTSNVLARVFYNSNTIKITNVSGPDASKWIASANSSGIIPISAALVNKINPQSLIINAKNVGNIQDTGRQSNSTQNNNGVTTGTFIWVTLLSAGVSIVGFIVFLTVGLVFIGRVVGLWIAMILAPLAFFSYTVPAMRNIEMVGWKKWWPNLLKLSFLAPVFIFFIYLILQFLQVGLGVWSANGKHNMDFVLAIIIPFGFIMILLNQAKKIAVKMSGQFGEALSKAGSAVGGMALGAATGGAALALKHTVGRGGSRIGNSETAKKMASSKNKFVRFLGNKTMDAGKSIGKNSFDLRNTKVGGHIEKGLGTNLGKTKTGGFEGYQSGKVRKQQQRAKELEVGENSEENKKLREQEIGLQDVLNSVVHDFENIDKKLKKARQVKKDGDPNAEMRIKHLKSAKKRIEELDGSKDSSAKITTDLTRARVKLAGMSPTNPEYEQTKDLIENLKYVDNANTHGKFAGKSIKDRKEDIKLSKHGIKKENTRRKVSFAKGLRTWGSKSNKEAQHKIIMESKIDDK